MIKMLTFPVNVADLVQQSVSESAFINKLHIW